MHTGDREITAEIREREQARREYEEAREQGQTASLLEQERPNVFKMNVANILPGDSIAVRLSYTELLVPTEKQYEFVLPTVVGPRYSPEAVNEILARVVPTSFPTCTRAKIPTTHTRSRWS